MRTFQMPQVYPNSRQRAVKAGPVRPSKPRPSPAFLAPGALVPVVEAAPALAPAAANPIGIAILGGFALGVGLGLGILWVFGEDGEGGDVTGNAAPQGTTYNYTWVPCPNEGPGNGNFVYSGNSPTDPSGLNCGLGDVWATPNAQMDPSHVGSFGWFNPDCIGGPSTCGYPDALVYEESIANPGQYFLRGMWDGFDTSTMPGEPYEELVPYGPVTSLRYGFARGLPIENEHPEDFPIMYPVLNPAPQPFADAVAPPGTQPSSPTRPVAPFTVPVHRFPIVLVEPSVPITVPPIIIDVHPDPEPGAEPSPPNPPGTGGSGGGGGGRNPRPPKKGEKEKKVRVKSRAFRGFLTVLGAVTESIDTVNALYFTLPKRYRRRGHTQWQRAEVVWEHLDEIDAATAVEAIFREQANDRMWGHVGKLAGKAHKKLGRLPGFGDVSGLQDLLP